MIRKFFKFKTSFLGAAALTIFSVSSAFAQDNTMIPKMPDPLQNLAAQGAQIRFLGKDAGVDGWIAIKNGQEQYFYVLPNGNFLSGLLFDVQGKAITIEQVRRLQNQNGSDLLDSLAQDPMEQGQAAKSSAEKYEFKTPSEQLYWDVENSNWIPLGKAGTPMLYAFVDPQCPFCHKMLSAIKPYIDKEQVQVRLVPVGFKPETLSQAAYLLATPNPSEKWWAHLSGDASALPAKSQISQQGVQRNLAVMKSWQISVTPLVVYRDKNNTVKIIRGNPKDLPALIRDLGARS